MRIRSQFQLRKNLRRQDQFRRNLKAAFEIFSRNMFADGPMSLICDMASSELFQTGPLEFADSSVSAGLQIIDVALWVFKNRCLGERVHQLQELSNCILARSISDEVSLNGHIDYVNKATAHLNQRRFSGSQLLQARETIEMLEQSRWKQPK